VWKPEKINNKIHRLHVLFTHLSEIYTLWSFVLISPYYSFYFVVILVHYFMDLLTTVLIILFSLAYTNTI